MLSFLLFVSVIFGEGYRLWFLILFFISICRDDEKVVVTVSNNSEG